MKNRLPLQTRCVIALNRCGHSDMHGRFYSDDSHVITRFILKKVRAEKRRELNELIAAAEGLLYDINTRTIRRLRAAVIAAGGEVSK